MLLYIIRHGDPNYENDTLTAKGKKQAAALAKRLAVHGLDKIYSSPMGRAKETAAPTCKRLRLEYEVEEWTSESLAWQAFSLPDQDGVRRWAFQMQTTTLRNSDTLMRHNWQEIGGFQGCPGAAQDYARIMRSSDAFLDRHGYKRDGGVYSIHTPSEERIAVFCHQGFGVIWLSHLLAVPLHLFSAGFDMTHTGVTILHFANNEDGLTVPRCLCLSDTSHIYKEGLPLEYQNDIPI